MSRTCDEIRAEIYTYLDDEASLWQRVRIRWHIRRCPPCENGAAFERKLQVRIREGCKDEVPKELYDRIRSFLAQHENEAGA
jgi:mycothiol system anti-sigma-R factor